MQHVLPEPSALYSYLEYGRSNRTDWKWVPLYETPTHHKPASTSITRDAQVCEMRRSSSKNVLEDSRIFRTLPQDMLNKSKLENLQCDGRNLAVKKNSHRSLHWKDAPPLPQAFERKIPLLKNDM